MTRIIKADAMNGQRAPQASVLNLTDVAAQARAIVLDARKQAAGIVADARLQAEQAQHLATRKAHAEGFARGQAEGYAEGKRLAGTEAHKVYAADSSELAAVAKRIVDELAAAGETLVEQARRETIAFALELAGKIVGEVAATDIQAAQVNLAKALGLAHGAANITVKVNPAQLERLTAHCQSLMENIGSTGQVRFVADGAIAAGGVKVHAGLGQIDATIQTQLDNVVEALIGKKSAGNDLGVDKA